VKVSGTSIPLRLAGGFLADRFGSVLVRQEVRRTSVILAVSSRGGVPILRLARSAAHS
jgi:hypothetical protein